MLPARPAVGSDDKLSALTNAPFTMLTVLPALKETSPPRPLLGVSRVRPLARVLVDIVLPAPDTEIMFVLVISTVPAFPAPANNRPSTIPPLSEVTLPPLSILM